MQPCASQLCTLRPEFARLDLPTQAAMVLACRIADAEAARRCERRHRELVEWIRRGERPAGR
jgi:hypothetical protein